jgi:hypothetical protein
MIALKNWPAESRCKIQGISPEIVLGLILVKSEFEKYGADLVITSCTDGRHGKGSLHYCGKAVDIRLPKTHAAEICVGMRVLLGPDFDVVLEKDHIHMEFDPKPKTEVNV